MPITGTITGKAAILATLAAMPDVVRSAFGDAVRTTASEIVREARSQVPVDTGTLRDHINFSFSDKYARAKIGVSAGTTTIAGTKVRGVVLAGRNGSALTSQGARVLRPSHYAHLVEFGHAGPHAAKAHAFLGPAFTGQLEPFDERMKAAQRQTLTDLANIGARYE
jgi:HK97 gp10 family phage protein